MSVQQHQQLDLGRAQTHGGGLNVGFVLHALQFQPLVIHFRDVACFEPIVAYLQQMVVVRQILPSEVQDGPLLQRLHERGAQIEKQITLLIGILGHCNLRLLLRTLAPQFALMPPFVQIGDGAGRKSVGEGRVSRRPTTGRSLRRERINLVDGSGQVRIRPKIRRDLLGARFVNENGRGPGPRLKPEVLRPEAQG